MNQVYSKFSIKPFLKSDDADVKKALEIYNSVTPNQIRTDITEIKYFIDNPENHSRKMFFIGLYYNEEIVGFGELAVLNKSRALIIDYIALAEGYRTNSIFFPFYNLILSYMEKTNLAYDYIITEINKDENFDKESDFFLRVLTLEDFKKISFRYFHPELGNKTESKLEAFILIRESSNAELTHLNSDTYLSLVQDIYMKHYLPWYQIFLTEDEISKYKKELEYCFDIIKKSINEEKTVLSTLTIPTSIDKNNKNSTSSQGVETKQKKVSTPLKTISVSVIIFLAVTFFTVVLINILKNYGIAPETFTLICSAIIGGVTTFWNIYQKSKSI